MASFKRFFIGNAVKDLLATARILVRAVLELFQHLDRGGLLFVLAVSCAVGRNRADLIFLVVFGGWITLASDLNQFVSIALTEIFMDKDNLVDAAGFLVEVVHIQLPLEGIEVAVLIELGKHVLFKHFSAFNFESLTVIRPMNYGLQILGRANLIKD